MLAKLIICSIFLSSSLLAKDTSNTDLFWRILFKDYHFGYTIFGNKPMCSHLSFVNTCRYTNICLEIDYMLSTLWHEWENNYISSSNNFCMKKVRYYELNYEWEEFYIINKEKCFKIIKDNFLDFKSCFTNLNSPEEILLEICNNGSHAIKNHHLIGILYGYGDFNSRKFKKRSDYYDLLATYIGLQDKKNLAKLEFHELAGMLYARKQSIFKPKESWDRQLKKYRKLSSQFASANSLVPHSRLLAIPFPCFVIAEENKETIDLVKDYKETEVKLNEVFYSNKFLDLILEKTGFKELHPASDQKFLMKSNPCK